MDGTTQAVLLGLARDVGKLVAGGLAAHGYIASSDTEMAISVIVGLATLGLSIYDKFVVQKKVQTALNTPPPAK